MLRSIRRGFKQNNNPQNKRKTKTQRTTTKTQINEKTLLKHRKYKGSHTVITKTGLQTKKIQQVKIKIQTEGSQVDPIILIHQEVSN